jgi:hypothetical protein
MKTYSTFKVTAGFVCEARMVWYAIVKIANANAIAPAITKCKTVIEIRYSKYCSQSFEKK